MVLLLLGLALVLATSSSLLATSGSGRGGNGGNPSITPNEFPEPGEISGSVSVTSEGELFLTTFVDYYSFLSSIEVIKTTDEKLEYKFRIIGIAELIDKVNQKINIDREKDTSKKEVKKTDNRMTKLTINIGRSNKMNPEMLIRLINKTTRSRNTEIGKIDIKKHHSTFEVNNNMKDIILSKMKDLRYDRKRIIVSDYNQDTFDMPINKKKKFKKRRRWN